MRGETTRKRSTWWRPEPPTSSLREISDLFALLADVEAMAWDAVEGYARFGDDVDEVAQMVGLSKATVYRRMDSRRREIANLRMNLGDESQVRDRVRSRAVAVMRILVDAESQSCDPSSTSFVSPGCDCYVDGPS